MCGIGAIYRYRGSERVSTLELDALGCRLEPRGPDGNGAWVSDDGSVGLTHRRLAIIDLSDRGAQPMHDHEHRLAITFNGEIYNYKELRRELESDGERFHSDSDTEVILRSYARQGPRMLARLRGMFAFAIWDARDRSLFLARDCFGIKPLYVARTSSSVAVASEIKALRSLAEVDTSLDSAAHVGFFLWGSVPEPFTPFVGIRAIPAGTFVRVDASGGWHEERFGSVRELLVEQRSSDFPLDATESQRAVDEAVRDSVRAHLIADVDVGVFLSAGRDSTTIASLACELSDRVRTVTLGFEEQKGSINDETGIAERVARTLGTDHSTVWISHADFDQAYTRFFDRMDSPTIDGVNSFFVSEAARRAGLKVALSGLGGDELFAGYPSFSQVPKTAAIFGKIPGARRLGEAVRRLVGGPIARMTSPKYASLLELGTRVTDAYLLRRGLFLPWELPSILPRDLVAEGLARLETLESLAGTIDDGDPARLQVSALEATWYMRNQLLRDTDWASMSHSLEVRVPLVDVALWRTVGGLIRSGNDVDKRSLARTPTRPLPPEVTDRKKTGFVVPTSSWLPTTRGHSARPHTSREWATFVYSRYLETIGLDNLARRRPAQAADLVAVA